MQSEIETDESDSYTLKINCKQKRTVRKANKKVNVEKYNRFKNLFNYFYKKQKEKKQKKKLKWGKKSGKLHQTTKAQCRCKGLPH